MDKLDKQILVVRIGVSTSIRNLKNNRTWWREENYNKLSRKLKELEWQKGIREFSKKLEG